MSWYSRCLAGGVEVGEPSECLVGAVEVFGFVQLAELLESVPGGAEPGVSVEQATKMLLDDIVTRSARRWNERFPEPDVPDDYAYTDL